MHKMDTSTISNIKAKVEQAIQHLAEGELDACFSLCAEIEKELQNKQLEEKHWSIISKIKSRKTQLGYAHKTY